MDTKPPVNGHRLFFALGIDEETRAALADAAERMAKATNFTPARPAWTPPANYHVTLHYLSSVESPLARELAEDLPRRLIGIPSFPMDLRHIGFFPHEKAPSVFWAGVWKAPDAMLELHRRLGAWIAARGIPVDERKFHGHVTLARFKSQRGSGIFVQNAQKYFGHAKFGVVQVNDVLLMESHLDPAGAKYTVFARGPLAGE